MLTVTEILTNANTHLRNNNSADLVNFPNADREVIIKDAIKKYSRVRPVTKLQAYTGLSVSWYDLPTSWQSGFSTITEIETPIEQTPPELMRPEHYGMSVMSGGEKIRFNANAPALGTAFWAKYTVMHSVDSNGQTDIDENDLDVISYLSASLLAKAFSAFYASKANSNIPNVDIVAYQTRSDEFQKISESFMEMYLKDVTDDTTGVYGNLDFVRDSYFSRDYD